MRRSEEVHEVQTLTIHGGPRRGAWQRLLDKIVHWPSSPLAHFRLDDDGITRVVAEGAPWHGLGISQNDINVDPIVALMHAYMEPEVHQQIFRYEPKQTYMGFDPEDVIEALHG